MNTERAEPSLSDAIETLSLWNELHIAERNRRR